MRLDFAIQPAGASGGLPFAVQPVVEVRDVNGAPSTTPIRVVLSAIGGAGDSLHGTKSAMTVGGKAVFDGLAINRAGRGYRLTARADSAVDAQSDSFEVAVGPPSAARSRVIADTSPAMPGDITLVTYTVVDAGGNPAATSGAAPEFLLAGGTSAGTFSPVASAVPGTYQSVFTATGTGTRAQLQVALGADTTKSPLGFTVLGFTTVSISDFNACALATDGSAYCWGRAATHALGASGAIRPLVPNKVAGGHIWTYVGAGADMACGLAAGGIPYCWGDSVVNSLPPAAAFTTALATEIPTGGATLSQLAVGWNQGACGIEADGTPICWGSDVRGESGVEPTRPWVIPSVVAGAPAFAGIGRDLFGACGITSAGDGYCWGDNLTGLLGVPDSTVSETCGADRCSPAAVPVPGATSLVPGTLSVGADYACALTGDGTAYCWGNGGLNNGQGSPAAPVATALRFSRIAVGGATICGIATDGWTYCWGDSYYGQTGTGVVGGVVTTPTRTSGDIHFTALDGGPTAFCGVADNQRAYCWGSNLEGELGDGTQAGHAVPALVHSVR